MNTCVYIEICVCICQYKTVVGSGRGTPAPLFWVEKIAKGRKAYRARNFKKTPPPLAQGLNPPLQEFLKCC